MIPLSFLFCKMEVIKEFSFNGYRVSVLQEFWRLIAPNVNVLFVVKQKFN